MKPLFLPAVITLSLVATAGLAAQQSMPPLKEDKPGLAAQATITPDSKPRSLGERERPGLHLTGAPVLGDDDAAR